MPSQQPVLLQGNYSFAPCVLQWSRGLSNDRLSSTVAMQFAVTPAAISDAQVTAILLLHIRCSVLLPVRRTCHPTDVLRLLTSHALPMAFCSASSKCALFKRCCIQRMCSCAAASTSDLGFLCSRATAVIAVNIDSFKVFTLPIIRCMVL